MPQTENSYSIIEDLKRTPSRMSLYDALRILGQLDLLRASLKVMNEGLDSILNLTEAAKYPGMGKNRPPPFYISLELEGFVVHNCLIDSGASITVMPKAVCDIMGLQHTRSSSGVLQLNGTNVKTVGVIKDIVMKLHQCPEVSVVQEVMVIELPALFGLCLSREFTSKLGGYLSMSYDHCIIPCKGRRIRIKREDAYPYHVERIEEADGNFGQMEDIDLLTKELSTLGTEAFGSFNTMTSGEHRNYCIPEPDTEIPALIKIEHVSNNI